MISNIKQKVDNRKYSENWDAIFGSTRGGLYMASEAPNFELKGIDRLLQLRDTLNDNYRFTWAATIDKAIEELE